MTSEDLTTEYFSKLRNLAIGLDKTLPQIEQEICEPKRNCIADATVIEEIMNIENNVAKIQEIANAQLSDVKKSNENMETELQAYNTRINSVESELTSIIDYLREYGISINKFENDAEQDSPEISELSKSASDSISKTPELENFSLSSPTMRLICSNSKEMSKNEIHGSYTANNPEFDLNWTPEAKIHFDSTETKTETPETPEMTTVFLPLKQRDTMDTYEIKNIKIPRKFNSKSNLAEPEFLCHLKLRKKNEDENAKTPLSTPKISLKYNFSSPLKRREESTSLETKNANNVTLKSTAEELEIPHPNKPINKDVNDIDDDLPPTPNFSQKYDFM